MSAERAGAERLLRLRVQLRPHVRIHRHEYRGEPWYVVQDPASGRAHRVSPAAREVLSLLDGERTLREVRDAAAARLGGEAPSTEELVALVGSLYRADLVTADARPDLEELAARGARLRRQRLAQYFLNPLALRFPLLDPDRFLARLAGALAPLPPWLWIWSWLGVVVAGAAVAAANWSTLTEGLLDRVFTAGNLLSLWVAYPVVKLLHEIAHGVAIRRQGGQVHEMGIMLLVLVPVPYVEASAAAAFPSKRARMLVGAAGILTELFLAGLAMLLWALLEPGALRAVCFNVALIGGVSSLLFNGNPLLRFDGYYVLADWAEVPNLGTRSNSYLGYLAQRYLFRVRDAVSPAASPGEARWLLGFGLCSAVYRVIVVVGIVLLVATKFFFIGVLLAIWGAAVMLVRPLAQGALFLVRSPRLEGRRRRAIAGVAGTVALAGLVIFFLPAPQWTRTEGIVWAPERSQVRAGTGCFVRAVLASPGGAVRKGQPLLECEDPELAASVRVLEAQLAELRARDLAYFVQSRLHLDVVREEIAVVEARLAEARRRHATLRMASPADGRFVMPQAADAPGRYVQRGEVLAHVIEPGAATVRVAVDQAEVDLVRAATRSVAVRPADRVPEIWPARLSREVPGAADRLPSLALSTQGGGRFGLDPRAAADPAEQPRAVTPVFQFDLEVPREAALEALGMRVHVRFEHEPAPLALQWYRGLRRVLLRVFAL